MKTLIVNLMAAPYAGQTVYALQIMSTLNELGLTTEYVTNLDDIGQLDNLQDLKNIVEKQYNKFNKLRDKVDVIITDSPFFLNLAYVEKIEKSFEQFILSCYNSFQNFNVFIEDETFPQREKIFQYYDKKMLLLLDSNGIYFGKYNYKNIEVVANNIQKTLSRLNRETIQKKLMQESIPQDLEIESLEIIELAHNEINNEKIISLSKEYISDNENEWESLIDPNYFITEPMANEQITMIEALEGAWVLIKKQGDILMLQSDETERFLVADELIDTYSINQTFYISSQKLTELFNRAENNDFNFLYENEEFANKALQDVYMDYELVLQNDDEKEYRAYLKTVKDGILGQNWYEAAMSKKDYFTMLDTEKKKKAISEYKNDKKYEYHTPFNLRDRKQFVGWKYEWSDEERKAKKIPYNPHTGQKASSIDSRTWAKFDDTCVSVDKYGFNGIGIMFGHKLMGIDIDHCIDVNGAVTERARDVVERINSYTEYSPSGTGLHILAFGVKPKGGNRRDEFEMYSEGRFFTLTGKPFEGKFRKIPALEVTQQSLEEVFNKYIKGPEKKPKPLNNQYDISIVNLSDQKIIEKCSKSKNGNAFDRMYYHGDISVCFNQKTGEPDHSACDQKLIGLLAYFTTDIVQIDRIFRSSALMRTKWDEFRGNQTYGQMTIEAAIATTTVNYDPKEFVKKIRKPSSE